MNITQTESHPTNDAASTIANSSPPAQARRPIKVAMVGMRGLDDGLGGVEKAVREIATRLVKNNVDVTCYCRPKYNHHEMYEGVRCINSATLYGKHSETALYAVNALWQAARSDADIVHVHAMASAALCSIPKRVGGKKVVVTIHGLDWQRAKWGKLAQSILMRGERAAVKHADHIICVSQSLRTYFYMRYMLSKLSMIPNGCDIIPADMPPPPGGQTKGSYLLYLGRLVPEKGADLLVEAFRGIDTDKHLVIAGPISHAPAFSKRLRDLAGDDPRIHFPGTVRGAQKESLLANAYAFVLPSQIEGLPITVLEAASWGVCPIISQIPTTVEALGDHQAIRGYSMNPYSLDEMRTSLRTCIEQEWLTAQLGEAARDYVKANFNWDTIARQTRQVYEKVLTS